MKRLKPKYLPLALAGGLPPGAMVTIEGLPGVFTIGAPAKPKHDYGIRSKNYPKPK